MKIYTRTGDKGETSLFGGQRVSKNATRIEVVGSLDELNSMLGLIVAFISAEDTNTEILSLLEQIQHDLFDIGAFIATPETIQIEKGKQLQKELPFLLRKGEKEFEAIIDQLTQSLPKLQNFILPGGGVIGAYLHLARAVVRRAERAVVTLSQTETVPSEVLIFMNRLSDLLFTLARYVNNQQELQEQTWKQSITRSKRTSQTG